MSTVFQFLPGRNRQKIKDFGSDSEAVLVASVPQNFAKIWRIPSWRGVEMECWSKRVMRQSKQSAAAQYSLLDRHQIGCSQTARRPENFANNDRVAQTRF